MIMSNDFRSNTLDKVWLKRYPADVPAEIDADRYSSLVEMFENAVKRYADQPAFINMGEVMTYRKLEERSRAFAAYLQNELGVAERRSCRFDDAESFAVSDRAVWYFACRYGGGKR